MSSVPRPAVIIALVILLLGGIMSSLPGDVVDGSGTSTSPAVRPGSVGPSAAGTALAEMSMIGRRAEHSRRAQRLKEASSWAAMIGGGDPLAGGSYDLVVVDGTPDRDGHVATTPAEIRELQARGALVLAYVSIGTVEAWRAHARDIPEEAVLDAVDEWPGEWYVDARSEVWQGRILDVATELERAGFDGLYLDNLDVAEDLPETAEGVVALVGRLRERLPELLLVAQNGLAVLDRLPVDAVAHEDVFWRWDGDAYRRSTDEEHAPLLEGLRRARFRGLPVFTLDYTDVGCPSADEVVARSRAEGFVPSVSVIELDVPPHAPPQGRHSGP